MRPKVETDVVPAVPPDDGRGVMAEGATRWLTYDDMATALGITADSARRLTNRHKWPRRAGNDGRALVAVPEDRLQQADEPGSKVSPDAAPDDGQDIVADVRRDIRALIAYLESRVGDLTSELAESRRLSEEARAEAREARATAETYRVQAGQVDVLTAVVAAERAHLAEVRVDRDRLVAILAGRKVPWFERFAGRLLKTG